MSDEKDLLGSLKRSFNYCNYRSRCEVLGGCLVEAMSDIPSPATLLDVGCGEGMERSPEILASLRAKAGRYWGVEPDPSAEVPQAAFDSVWRSTLEDSGIPGQSVDLAYSCMVAEHIQDPLSFARRLHDILKPGGQFFMLTINGRSYLGRLARWANRLRVQEALLRLAVGRADVERYHYPAFYRFNTERQIRPVAEAAGFAKAEFIYLERGEATGYYWPSQLRWIGRTIDWKHRVLGQSDRFNNLLAVLTK